MGAMISGCNCGLSAPSQALPVWEQTPVDAEGRRRFHGAFTGGFSAGFFNTVGSAEGWQPKTFVSSRSNRQSVQQVRPALALASLCPAPVPAHGPALRPPSAC